MRRFINYYLENWKSSPRRKPLLLRGARQVGKTHAARQLGRSYQGVVEVNLERNKHASMIFEPDLDPERIIRELALLTGHAIIPGKTLLFLDEIQAVPKALTSLRYFYEEMPKLHVIAAGSLIDFALEQVGIPVGRVTSLHVRPLSFMEFLCALDKQHLAKAIMSHPIEKDFAQSAHTQLLDIVGHYLAIGGMPEAVKCWRDAADPNQCFEVHQELITAYRQDFNKYAKKTQLKYLDIIFKDIPRQVGCRFKYSAIDGDYRKRELAPCLDLLCKAGVAQKVIRSAANGLPLGGESYPNDFKVIFLDVAIGQAVLGHDPRNWILDSTNSFANNGGLMEAYVGQELLCYSDPRGLEDLYYWHRSQRTSQAEVDYVCAAESSVIPVEVKAGPGTTLRSLRQFLDGRPKSPYGVRFSTQNYSVHEDVHSYPLYAIAQTFLQDREAFKFLLKQD